MEKVVNKILHQIKKLQSRGNDVFPVGLFPSERFHSYLPYIREDDNLFFTTIIVFTLQQLKGAFKEKEQEIINEIVRKAINSYKLYRNKDGIKTYNFWQTNPTRHFPNGYLLNRLDFLELPDDVDDTALVYLTNPGSADELHWLKQKLVLHANMHKKQIRNTLPKYKQLKAYSTWFGKDMYIEFDFCVLCNLMYLVFENRLSLNENDYDSITFLQSVIVSNEHFTHTFQVAPSYPKPSLILYHFSRLIAAFDIPRLSHLRTKTVNDIHKTLRGSIHPMEKVLLSTSLMRLGERPVSFEFSDNKEFFRDFYFFNGGMLTAFENPLCRKLAKCDVFHLKHQCEAYNYALLLEHEVLKGKAHEEKPLKTKVAY